MLYLSQILNSKVKDSSDKTIGRLKDILVKPKAGAYVPLVFLLIAGRHGREFFAPYEYVENLSKEEIIKAENEFIRQTENKKTRNR